MLTSCTRTAPAYVPQGLFETIPDTEAFKSYRDVGSKDASDEPDEVAGGEITVLAGLHAIAENPAEVPVPSPDAELKANRIHNNNLLKDINRERKLRAGAGKKTRMTRSTSRFASSAACDELGELLGGLSVKPNETLDLGAELEKMSLGGSKRGEESQGSLQGKEGAPQPAYNAADKNSVHARFGRALQAMSKTGIQTEEKSTSVSTGPRGIEKNRPDQKSMSAQRLKRKASRKERQQLTDSELNIIYKNWPPGWLDRYFQDTITTHNGKSTMAEEKIPPHLLKYFVALSALAPPLYVAKLLSEQCNKPRTARKKQDFEGPKQMLKGDLEKVVQRIKEGGINLGINGSDTNGMDEAKKQGELEMSVE